jgi:hypothetical protein
MRDDKRRFRDTGDDHVARVAVVGFYVALACSYTQSLFPSLISLSFSFSPTPPSFVYRWDNKR